MSREEDRNVMYQCRSRSGITKGLLVISETDGAGTCRAAVSHTVKVPEAHLEVEPSKASGKGLSGDHRLGRTSLQHQDFAQARAIMQPRIGWRKCWLYLLNQVSILSISCESRGERMDRTQIKEINQNGKGYRLETS